MEPIFFENLIVKLLFTSAEDRDRLYPYLSNDLFESFENQKIITSFLDFKNKYDKFPTVKELEIFIENKDVFNKLKSVMDIDSSEYNDQYIRDEIEEFFRKRMLWNDINEMVDVLKAESVDKISHIPDKVRNSLSFSFDTTVGLDLKQDMERLYQSLHNKEKTISSGIKMMDKPLSGGFHEKSLTLYLLETNGGKSLIMCSLAVNSLLQNKNVLYVSGEMSEDKISERIMANLFDVELNNLFLLSKDKFVSKYESCMKPLKSNFIIKEYPTRSFNTNKIRALCKELKIKKNFVPDIIFVDYLGIMLPNMMKKEGNTNTEMKIISEELRGLAVELGLPIVSAMQLNRGGFGAAEIDLTDIADSIGTTMTADVIFGATQTDELRAAGLYSFFLLKNRYGLNKLKFPIGVDYPKMRVYDVSEEIQEDKPVQPINIIDDASVKVHESIKNNKKIEKKKIIDIDFD